MASANREDTGSVRNAEAPDGREQWIGGALDEADELADEWSCDAHEKKRRGEADEAAGENVEGVMLSDEDAAGGDDCGCCEEDGAGCPVE